MAGTGQPLREFMLSIADIEEEEVFVERYPFPFLVQEEVRDQRMDEPVAATGARGTIRVNSTAVPKGLGPRSKVFVICPKNPDDFDGEVTLGRDESCDVVVDEASISTLHAGFTLEGEADDPLIRVHDKGSTNGTFVDGDMIEASGSALVEDSCGVRFGPACKFQFFTPGSLFNFLSFYRKMKR